MKKFTCAFGMLLCAVLLLSGCKKSGNPVSGKVYSGDSGMDTDLIFADDEFCVKGLVAGFYIWNPKTSTVTITFQSIFGNSIEQLTYDAKTDTLTAPEKGLYSFNRTISDDEKAVTMEYKEALRPEE